MLLTTIMVGVLGIGCKESPRSPASSATPQTAAGASTPPGPAAPKKRGAKFALYKPAAPGERSPGLLWERIPSPEAVGWSSDGLERARQHAKKIGATAVMVVLDGAVLAAWGDTRRRSYVHSVRKSLLSALYGIYVQEGKIDLNATLEDLSIDDKEGLTREEKQAQVRHLLKGRSGVYHRAAAETDNMKRNRPARGSHLPGAHYFYNNWDFNALGTIFRRQTGQDIFKAFEQRIARPLQMQDFRTDRCRYSFVDASRHPAYLFRLSTRDMARFGLLFLRQGRWRDQQLIPREWVRESTYNHSPATRRDRGYGYMWGIAQRGRIFNTSVPGTPFAAKGHGGQVILVIPRLNLVVAQKVEFRKTGKKVSSKKFGTLLKLILAAKKS